ncbi:MAG TPA: class I SAM-dependent methyltransferase [Pseudolabrys sp.]|nr:class I SAM-dependent methyltransferase [Pseudolabrys sp.]
MDQQTLTAYDGAAAGFAADWESQPTGLDLQSAVREFFRTGRTAGIGCGSGRDAAWLAQVGFPTTGYDASDALLREARRRHPGIAFERASLPELAGVEDASFTNVLCETVIMHLPRELIPEAVRRLLAILEPGGTLYLGWRVTAGADQRDGAGRLYAAFSPQVIRDALGAAQILLDEELRSASSGKLIHRIVGRKRGIGKRTSEDIIRFSDL